MYLPYKLKLEIKTEHLSIYTSVNRNFYIKYDKSKVYGYVQHTQLLQNTQNLKYCKLPYKLEN